MFSLNIEQICRITRGESVNCDLKRTLTGVEIDSRKLLNDMIFVPIIGENVDAHIFFTKDLADRGIVSFWNVDHEKPQNDLPVIYVEDTLKAMQDLASYYIRKIDPIVIAITGSNGKTSTKDLLTSILSKRYKVSGNEGNLNTDIGLPYTVLKMPEDTEIEVLEMGIDHFGDMTLMSNIANPDIAIVTGIGEAHLDDLLTREGIAKGKLEFVPNMKNDSVIVYNGDEPLIEAELERRKPHSKLVPCGYGAKNTYIPEMVSIDEEIKFILVKPPMPGLTLKTVGIKQIMNATMAIAAALELDCTTEEIIEGLYEAKLTGMRTELEKRRGLTFLNDAYKSNPSALRAGLESLYLLKGYKRKILILGDMLGIGSEAAEYHKEIGQELDPENVDYVFTVGGIYADNITNSCKVKFGDKSKHLSDTEELLEELRPIDLTNSIIFLKASRSLEFEKIIERIAEEFGN